MTKHLKMLVTRKYKQTHTKKNEINVEIGLQLLNQSGGLLCVHYTTVLIFLHI